MSVPPSPPSTDQCPLGRLVGPQEGAEDACDRYGGVMKGPKEGKGLGRKYILLRGVGTTLR